MSGRRGAGRGSGLGGFIAEQLAAHPEGLDCVLTAFRPVKVVSLGNAGTRSADTNHVLKRLNAFDEYLKTQCTQPFGEIDKPGNAVSGRGGKNGSVDLDSVKGAWRQDALRIFPGLREIVQPHLDVLLCEQGKSFRYRPKIGHPPAFHEFDLDAVSFDQGQYFFHEAGSGNFSLHQIHPNNTRHAGLAEIAFDFAGPFERPKGELSSQARTACLFDDIERCECALASCRAKKQFHTGKRAIGHVQLRLTVKIHVRYVQALNE